MRPIKRKYMVGGQFHGIYGRRAQVQRQHHSIHYNDREIDPIKILVVDIDLDVLQECFEVLQPIPAQ